VTPASPSVHGASKDGIFLLVPGCASRARTDEAPLAKVERVEIWLLCCKHSPVLQIVQEVAANERSKRSSIRGPWLAWL